MLLYFKIKKGKTFYVILFVAVFIMTLLIKNNYLKNQFVYSSEGIYSSLNIKDDFLGTEPIRLLLRDKNKSSGIYLNSKKTLFPYIRFNFLHDNLVTNPDKILILGGGAYNAPRILKNINPNLNIDVIELEPGLFELAQKYFDLDDISNFTMDARVFLQRENYKKYDYIFSDVFGSDSYIPFHLTTKEFYKLIEGHLSKNGVFVLNTVGKIETEEPSMIGSIYKTLDSVFSNVKIYGFDNDVQKIQNVIFVVRNGNKDIEISNLDLMLIANDVYELPYDTFNLSNEILLTDDHAPVEYLMNMQM